MGSWNLHLSRLHLLQNTLHLRFLLGAGFPGTVERSVIVGEGQLSVSQKSTLTSCYYYYKNEIEIGLVTSKLSAGVLACG